MRLLCLLVCASAVAIACAGAGGASFPGRNGLVASSESTPFGDAIEVNATGGGATPVLPSGVALAGPVVPSPDGTRLAYTTALFDAGPDLVSMLARPGGADRAAWSRRHFAGASPPAWSPRRLARRVHGARSAPSRSPRGSFVDVANADGSDVRRIAAGDQPVWSPDGQLDRVHAGAGRPSPSSSTPTAPDGHPVEQDTGPVDARHLVVGRVVAGLAAPRDRRRAAASLVVSPAGGRPAESSPTGYDPIRPRLVPRTRTTLAFVGSEPGICGARSVFERAGRAAARRRRSLRRPRTSSASPGSRRGRLDGSRLLVSGLQTTSSRARFDRWRLCTSSTVGPDYPWQLTGPGGVEASDSRTRALRAGRGSDRERSRPAQTQRRAAPPADGYPGQRDRTGVVTGRARARVRPRGRPTETQAVFSSYDSTACTDSS